MRYLFGFICVLALSAVVVGCSSEDASCVLGSEGCACNLGKCLTGLECLSGLCVDPGGTGGTVGSGGSAGFGGTAGSGGSAGSGGNAGTGGSGGAAGSAAPAITKVQWEWADDPCMVDTTSTVTVTVFATDDETQPDELVYSLAVSDCTPAMVTDVSVSVVTILDCPPRNPDVERLGTVIVTDPEDNSDTVSFGFFACESDEVCEDGNPCE